MPLPASQGPLGSLRSFFLSLRRHTSSAPSVLLISIGFYLVIEQPCMRSDWPARLKAFFTGKSRSVALASK